MKAPASRSVPNSHRMVIARGSHQLAIRTENSLPNRGAMALEGGETTTPLSLQVVPFPAAQVNRAFLQELVGPADAVGLRLTVCQGDLSEVLDLLLALKRFVLDVALVVRPEHRDRSAYHAADDRYQYQTCCQHPSFVSTHE